MYLQELSIVIAAFLVVVVFMVGGAIKGALGFGLPLVTMALMTNFIPVQAALVINALVLPFANIAQFMKPRLMRETVWRFRYVLAGLILGTPCGAYLVGVINEPVLMFVLGLFVLLFSISSLFDMTFVLPQRYIHSSGTVVGLTAGIVGALTTTNGPIFIMYLVSLKEKRIMFLSALGLFFVVSGVMISSSFLAAGLVDIPRVILAAFALPSALLGMKIGNTVGNRIPQRIFKIGVAGMLCILGLNLFLRGLGNI